LGAWNLDFSGRFSIKTKRGFYNLSSSKVRLEFWMADRLGFDQPGPVILEEPL
jgi:hypothetical protein